LTFIKSMRILYFMSLETLKKRPEIIENKSKSSILPRIGTIKKIINDEIKNNGLIEQIKDFKNMEKKDQKDIAWRTAFLIGGLACIAVSVSKIYSPASGVFSGIPDLKEVAYGDALMVLGGFLVYKSLSGDEYYGSKQ